MRCCMGKFGSKAQLTRTCPSAHLRSSLHSQPGSELGRIIARVETLNFGTVDAVAYARLAFQECSVGAGRYCV
jgi:hypothetical protein